MPFDFLLIALISLDLYTLKKDHLAKKFMLSTSTFIIKNILIQTLKKVEKYLKLPHIVSHRRSFDDRGPLIDFGCGTDASVFLLVGMVQS
jgi:hypothetical protein